MQCFGVYVELDSGCVFVEMQEEPKESPAEATSDPGLGRGGQQAEVGRSRSRVRTMTRWRAQVFRVSRCVCRVSPSSWVKAKGPGPRPPVPAPADSADPEVQKPEALVAALALNS